MELCRAETENHLEDTAEENQTDSEANAFLERFGELNFNDNVEHEVSTGDKVKNTEERFHIEDFQGRIFGVNRDKRFPTFLTGFSKDFPTTDNRQDGERETKEAE